MNKSFTQLFSVISLCLFLCFSISCQNQEAKAELEEMKAQAEVEAQNKDIIERYNDEIWNKGNLALTDELFATDFVNHDPNPPGVTDLESYKGWVVEHHNAYPDFHVEVHDMVAEGDKVAARCTVTGTHQGEFYGIPPSGNRVTMRMINIHRLADNKIVEAWWSYDMLGMLEQLGFVTPVEGGPPFMDREPEDYPWGPSSDVTGDPGDPESNKNLIIHEEADGWNQGDADVALEPIAPSFFNHPVIWPSVIDYESYKQWVKGHIDPDNPTQITIENLVAEGDKIVEHWTAAQEEGTTLSGMSVHRFADGKIVERWLSKDVLPVLQARGLVPQLPAQARLQHTRLMIKLRCICKRQAAHQISVTMASGLHGMDQTSV